MAKYKESQVTITEWATLGKAKFVFPINGPTRVDFSEEQIREQSGTKAITSRRELSIELTDPQTKIILVNPDDNVPTGGDLSYKQLERAIYSLYYSLALAKDAQEQNNG